MDEKACPEREQLMTPHQWRQYEAARKEKQALAQAAHEHGLRASPAENKQRPDGPIPGTTMHADRDAPSAIRMLLSLNEVTPQAEAALADQQMRTNMLKRIDEDLAALDRRADALQAVRRQVIAVNVRACSTALGR